MFTMDVDKGYAWIVMMANFGAMALGGGLVYSAGLFITTLQERFHENVAKTALVGSLFTALGSLSGYIGSFIISHTSCRVTLMIGASCMTTGFLITAFSTSLTLCIGSCGILAGVGAGVCYVVLYIVNGYHFKRKLNFATGVSMSGGGVGLFLLPPLLEKAREFYGYPGLFLLAAGVSLQLIVLGALMRPSVLEIEAKKHRKVNSASGKVNEGTIKVYLKLLSDRATLCLVLCFGCFSGGLYSAYMFWPSLCLANGFNAMEASLFLSISGIAAIVGRLAIGVIASNSLVDIFNLYCVSLTGLGVPCVLFKFYGSSLIGQIINAVVIGTFSGAPLVIFAEITMTCVGLEYLPVTGGLQFLSGGLGSIGVPVLCGYLVTRGWTYGDVLIACGAVLLVGAVLALVTKFTDKRLCRDTALSSTTEDKPFVNPDPS